MPNRERTPRNAAPLPVELGQGLASLLAGTYTLYNTTQEFHWNVEGRDFAALHALFEEQYAELAEAIDEIAERIRALGFYTPGTLQQLMDRSPVSQEPGVRETERMLELLIDGHRQLADLVRELQPVAEESRDEATFDLLVERQRVHEKASWMLESQAGWSSAALEAQPMAAQA